MKVTLRQFQMEQEETYLLCIKEIVREQNPFTFLSLQDDQEEHIKEWICKHSDYLDDQHTLLHITYWIMLDDQVIGIATLKKELSQALYADSGHIGICLMPSYRRKGFATSALEILLHKAQNQYHMEDILLCCTYDNIASRKLCERVGGILKHEDSFVHYWITQHIQTILDV